MSGNRAASRMSKLQLLDYFFPGLFVTEISEEEDAVYDYASCYILAPRKQGVLSNWGPYKQKINETEDCLLGNRRSETGYRNFNAAHNMLRRASADLSFDPGALKAMTANLRGLYSDHLNEEQQETINARIAETLTLCRTEETASFCTKKRADGLSFERNTYDALLETLSGYFQSGDYAECWAWLCIGSLFGNYVSDLLESGRSGAFISRDIRNTDARRNSASPHLISSPAVIVNPGFTGRQDYLERIDGLFSEGNRVIFLCGIGGIGKSEIARQYAHTRKNLYDVIVFAVYDRSLKDLVIADTPFETDPPQSRLSDGVAKETDDAYFHRKLDLIRKNADERTLIIIDNFNTENDDGLSEFINGRYRVIFTTQYDYSRKYASVKVREIEDEEELKNIFMNNYQGYAVERDDPELMRLIRLVSSHTFTIILLARHMENSGQTAAEMIEALNREGIVSLNERIPDSAGTSREAWQNLIRMFRVSDFSAEEQSVLRLLSLVYPVSVPAMLFKKWADLSSAKSILSLEKRGWIVRGAEGISLYPVVYGVVHYLCPVKTDEIRPFLEHITESITEQSSWMFTKAQKEQFCVILRSVVGAVGTVDENTAAFYLATVAIFGYSGYPERAIELGAQLMRYEAEAHGEDSYEYAGTAFQTGWIYLFNPHLPDALGNALSWLTKAAAILESSDQDTVEKRSMYIRTLENISKAHSCRYDLTGSAEDFKEAERFAERAVRLARAWLCENNKSITCLGGSLLRLSDIYVASGAYEEAEKLIDEAQTILASLRADQNAMNPDILRATSRRAVVLYYLGRYRESLDETERNLNYYQIFYGSDNPSLFDQLILKIKNCRELGYAEQAEAAAQEAYETGRLIFTPDSPKLLQLQTYLS